MIPTLAVVRVEDVSGRRFRMWLPLFLLWIPLAILSPMILAVLLVVCVGGRVSFWKTAATLWQLGSGLAGTDVRVTTDGRRVTARIR